jgi:hypothetical protein
MYTDPGLGSTTFSGAFSTAEIIGGAVYHACLTIDAAIV